MSRPSTPKLSRLGLKASEEEVELLSDSDADLRPSKPARSRPASPLPSSQYVSLQINSPSSPIYIETKDYVEFDEEATQAEAIDSAYRNPSWCCAISVLSTTYFTFVRLRKVKLPGYFLKPLGTSPPMLLTYYCVSVL